jgi:hypothetical protein
VIEIGHGERAMPKKSSSPPLAAEIVRPTAARESSGQRLRISDRPRHYGRMPQRQRSASFRNRRISTRSEHPIDLRIIHGVDQKKPKRTARARPSPAATDRRIQRWVRFVVITGGFVGLLVWLMVRLFKGDATAADLAMNLLYGLLGYSLPRPPQAGPA